MTKTAQYAIVDSSSRIVSLHDSRESASAEGWGHDRELVRLVQSGHEVGDLVDYSERGVELDHAAAQRGDTLYDSDTNGALTAEDLEVTDEEYEELVRCSYAQGTAEGHIRLDSGRLVYAAV